MGLSCQFAVTAWDLSSPAALAGLPQQAKQAEAMGFEGFWLPEHHFQGGASLSAPLILLAACAAWILLQGFGPDESPPERGWTTLGAALGLGCVLLRRLGVRRAALEEVAHHRRLERLLRRVLHLEARRRELGELRAAAVLAVAAAARAAL